jgi:hypothetical protein
MMPEVGEKVTVVRRFGPFGPFLTRQERCASGVVCGRLDGHWDPGMPMSGFSVELDAFDHEQINLWELDPDFVEGVGWARGWEGPEVDALVAAEALT